MKLIARIRTRAAGLKDGEMWHEITLHNHGDGSGMVRCSCGGTVLDHLKELKFDILREGCLHLTAFYLGKVTEDPSAADSSPLVFPSSAMPWLVQLTPLGEKLFRWRWAQKILERSS